MEEEVFAILMDIMVMEEDLVDGGLAEDMAWVEDMVGAEDMVGGELIQRNMGGLDTVCPGLLEPMELLLIQELCLMEEYRLMQCLGLLELCLILRR